MHKIFGVFRQSRGILELQWPRAWKAIGDELYMHGYRTHVSVRFPIGSMDDKIVHYEF